MNLSELEIGEKGIISKIELEGMMKRRILDLGFIKGTKVECVLKSPLKDPKAYLIRGSVFALRKEEAEKIEIRVDHYA